MVLNVEQEEAVRLALNPKVSKLFITGSGGTGKSQIIKEIVDSFKQKDLILLAPTHSAARNINGKTIHSFFKINMSMNINAKKEEDVLDCDLSQADFDNSIGKVVIIDEISMVGKKMLDNIIANMPVKKLILVGDPYQLAPVKDHIVDWGAFCDTEIELKINYRTADKKVLKAIDYYRDNLDEGVLEMLPVVQTIKDLRLTEETVFIAHKNRTLSNLQKACYGYTGAKQGDSVLTFGTCSEHLIADEDMFGDTKMIPYFVNGDALRVISDPVDYYGEDLYSVEVRNPLYSNGEIVDKNVDFPSNVEVMVGDFDEYKRLLRDRFKAAQTVAQEMLKKYGTGEKGETASSLKRSFTKEEKWAWGSIWRSYFDVKTKVYARHSQFMSSYKVQGKSIDDIVVHWSDLPSEDHKYVALSRAKHSIQILN